MIQTSNISRRKLLALAWPIFIEQVLHLLLGVVDTFMVSHIADDAVAALGAANQVVVLFIMVFSFVGMGASVVVTHHLGGGDREGADHIAVTAIGVNTWLGLVVSVLVYLCAEPMLRMMQLSDKLLMYGVPFLAWMGGTLFLESMNLGISAVLRAHKHTYDAMVVTIVQNLINFAGNAILLFGLFGFPKMGVVGVAIATVFSRFVACLALWVLLEYRTRIKVNMRDLFRPSRERLASILHIGLPAAGENISWWLAFMTVTAFTARMGDQALATQSYTMQLVSIVVLCSVAIGMATEITIGHLVGAGRFAEAYVELMRNVRMGLAIAVCVAITVALATPTLLGVFTKDTVIIATGALLMRIGIVLEPGRVFNIVIINGLRATGDARYPVMIGVLSMASIMAFGSWLLGTYFGWGLPGVWIAMLLDEWLRGVLMYRRWKRRKWLKYAERTHAKVLAAGEGA